MKWIWGCHIQIIQPNCRRSSCIVVNGDARCCTARVRQRCRSAIDGALFEGLVRFQKTTALKVRGNHQGLKQEADSGLLWLYNNITLFPLLLQMNKSHNYCGCERSLSLEHKHEVFVHLLKQLMLLSTSSDHGGFSFLKLGSF